MTSCLKPGACPRGGGGGEKIPPLGLPKIRIQGKIKRKEGKKKEKRRKKIKRKKKWKEKQYFGN